MEAPVDLTTKTITTKVSPAAWARAKALAKRFDARVSDVFSICLLHMPADRIELLVDEQKAATSSLPKVIRGVLSQAHRMTAAEKAAIIEALTNA